MSASTTKASSARTTIEAALVASDLVEAAHAFLLDPAQVQLGVAVVPSSQGWAMVDTRGRQSYTEALRNVLAGNGGTSLDARCWRLVPALPRNAQGITTEAAALALFDPRRPFVRLLERQRDCVTLAVEIDPALPYFEGHFDRAAVLAGVVQVEWAVRFGREWFNVGDDFRCMQALKFQKVVRPGDAVKMVLDWNRDAATLTFGFSSQAGQHSSGRIVFGAAS